MDTTPIMSNTYTKAQRLKDEKGLKVDSTNQPLSLANHYLFIYSGTTVSGSAKFFSDTYYNCGSAISRQQVLCIH